MVIVLVSAVVLLTVTTLISLRSTSTIERLFASTQDSEPDKTAAGYFRKFFAHLLEMTIYGFVYFALVEYCNVGTLEGTTGFSLSNCLYFSAESYTSLGFGDIAPKGPIRMLVGVEALNGCHNPSVHVAL